MKLFRFQASDEGVEGLPLYVMSETMDDARAAVALWLNPDLHADLTPAFELRAVYDANVVVHA